MTGKGQNGSALVPTLSIAKAFEGKRILFTGSTGFVGKVTLSMLMHRYPRVGKIYPLVRPTLGSTAEARFFGKVATSPAFDPIRQVWGAAYDEVMRGKVEPLPGDVTEPGFELDAATIEKLTGQVDAVVNIAGLVSFSPALDTALRINTLGARYGAQLAKKLGAAYIHVSTCFTAGNRDGAVWENEPVLGYFPRHKELPDEFDPDAEVKDCERIAAEVRARAEDRQLQSSFREKARARLRDEGRDDDDERAVKLAAARERKLWIADQLTKAGMARAQHWGWANIYCYTKALGDQLIAATPGLRYAIVKPAIVESARRYPMVGWNEGMTTSAPLAFMSLKGHSQYPAGDGTFLDMVPVDAVAAGIVAVIGATLLGENEPVYQLGSSDSNPITMRRAVELVGLHRRRWFRERESGPKLLNEIFARVEALPVSRERYERMSAPAVRRITKGISDWLDENRPRWGAPRTEALFDRAKERLARVERIARETEAAFDLFMPFIYERHYIFRCDNIRALMARMTAEDRAALLWDPETIDWRTYWLDIHMEGLKKWVFPSLEEEFKEKPKSVYAYRDLLEMFESASKRFKNKTAMRMLEEGGEELRYTYGELKQLADAAGRTLVASGIAHGDRVLLVSENRPEWGISYFGVMKAGAVCVPVDPQLKPAEIANIARSAGAKVAIASDEYADKCEGLRAFRFEELFASVGEQASVGGHEENRVPSINKPDDLASLIFTSGTTGTPKGVMLSHRNFTSLIAKLQGVFGMRKADGLLSVLPLHHTFEFTSGLLMPLSRGAEIDYLDEVAPERIREAMKSGRITALVGVPALWQALSRKITNELDDKGPVAKAVVHGLATLNRKVRNKTILNFGKALFWPVHKRFGGRVRMMISGGSALQSDVMKLFHGLGFSLYEGYGLTEAAPVLTVMRPSNKLLQGTVGEALPGVEVRIHEPDTQGVGEVIARGPNVMAGYYQNEEATREVLRDGWLHTGDLGRIDEDGRLHIVGRQKDVIIDANGKNVYPDELEELYGDSPWIKELSIVGVPDEDGGETIACLCVPSYEHDKERPREDVRRRAFEKLSEVSGALPFYKRVKIVHMWDGELPRTATRKVKRKLVISEIARLERASKVATEAKSHRGGAAGEHQWLVEVVAQVSGRSAVDVGLDSKFSDLGYDSLMYTELGVALEAAGATIPEDLTGVQTLRDLVKLLGSSARRAPGARKDLAAKGQEKADDLDEKLADLDLPDPIQNVGRSLLAAGQKFVYANLFDTKIHGEVNIPATGRFLVVANHSSHLDLGLVKHALGPHAENVVALAAKDYFFDSWRGAYFKNFTNLLPMERQGSFKESLRLASDVIKRGRILLIFPEGTRSVTGEMAEFKASVGYLALSNKIDVLPMYLEGTHDSMPKGQALPSNRKLAVRIGPPVTCEMLKRHTESLPRAERYRAASGLIEEAVKCLRDGRRFKVQVKNQNQNQNQNEPPVTSHAGNGHAAAAGGKAKTIKRPRREKVES